MRLLYKPMGDYKLQMRKKGRQNVDMRPLMKDVNAMLEVLAVTGTLTVCQLSSGDILIGCSSG